MPFIERQRLGRSDACISIQEAGGVRKTVEAGIKAVAELLPVANEARRTPQPVSELVLATNCGGSDGNSGITANPALGWAVDELVRYGGTGVLAETSEIYGAEHLLIRRAVNEGVAKKLIDRFKWWEYYCRVLGAEMDNNPAPGNKAGGLTTVFEKSLGGVTKGGTTPLTDVFLYGEPITTRGFVFMDTPGHDPVSVTGLVAGGANIVVFTTGRGSVFGCRPVPSIKLATNSLVYRQMEEDMDINCGVILEGTPLRGRGAADLRGGRRRRVREEDEEREPRDRGGGVRALDHRPRPLSDRERNRSDQPFRATGRALASPHAGAEGGMGRRSYSGEKWRREQARKAKRDAKAERKKEGAEGRRVRRRPADRLGRDGGRTGHRPRRPRARRRAARSRARARRARSTAGIARGRASRITWSPTARTRSGSGVSV